MQHLALTWVIQSLMWDISNVHMGRRFPTPVLERLHIPNFLLQSDCTKAEVTKVFVPVLDKQDIYKYGLDNFTDQYQQARKCNLKQAKETIQYIS